VAFSREQSMGAVLANIVKSKEMAVCCSQDDYTLIEDVSS
jgi:hypothetical protein